LVKELSVRLTSMDARWLAFGLNRPGQKATPEVPENVTAEVVAPDKATVKWEPAPRAEHYRVWARVKGSEQEMEVVASRTNHDFTFENLAPGSALEVAITAVNNGGESRKSEVVIVAV
jgi:fibronectin type 3 domain-containing protein